MTKSPGELGLYDGFEGYRDPTEGEVLALLKDSPVVLDTNVLLDIYGFEEPARALALDVLEVLGARLWIPHQVIREFWRNRHNVIADLRSPAEPIERVRGELLAVVNSLRPDSGRPEEIEEMRATVEKQLSVLADAIRKARGTPLNRSIILRATSDDPVLERLETILKGRVGPSFGDEEPSLVEHGIERFASRTPPGYKDGEDKADQLPERGTGDFLLWEQTLRYIASLKPKSRSFILVTNDSKEDWRINVVPSGEKKQSIGVRPELVAEALERTGCRLVLLRQNDFYRLMAEMQSGEGAASDSLVQASTLTRMDDLGSDVRWSAVAYDRILSELRVAGNQIQADIISLAAKAGGFISRAEIYAHAGFHEDRSLKRFALPAQRIALEFAEEGLISHEAAAPLEAIYEGPGKAIGYRVPEEFADYESRRATGMTWIQAAAHVASDAPDRVWAISDLVAGVKQRGLRDTSGARTPEATLLRDLTQRDDTYFDQVNGGFRLRPGNPSSVLS